MTGAQRVGGRPFPDDAQIGRPLQPAPGTAGRAAHLVDRRLLAMHGDQIGNRHHPAMAAIAFEIEKMVPKGSKGGHGSGVAALQRAPRVT